MHCLAALLACYFYSYRLMTIIGYCDYFVLLPRYTQYPIKTVMNRLRRRVSKRTILTLLWTVSVNGIPLIACEWDSNRLPLPGMTSPQSTINIKQKENEYWLHWLLSFPRRAILNIDQAYIVHVKNSDWIEDMSMRKRGNKVIINIIDQTPVLGKFL